MNNDENILQIEQPDVEAVVDFFDIEGRNGMLVIITRRPDMGFNIRVRQHGPRGSSMFRDTDFSIDPYDTGEDPEPEDEDEPWETCSGCGELGVLDDDELCEDCAVQEPDWQDPAGGDDGDDDAPEGA